METDQEFSSQTWLDETAPFMKSYSALLRTKYIIQHMSAYLKWLERKGEHIQPWAFTLTTNERDKDKWPAVEDEMKQAALKILNQKTCPIKSGEAYLEYCEDGKPHIHGFYIMEDGKRIFAKIFKRYWPLWNEAKKMGDGHQGGYHKRVINEIRYTKYQSAEERLVCKYPVEEEE